MSASVPGSPYPSEHTGGGPAGPGPAAPVPGARVPDAGSGPDGGGRGSGPSATRARGSRGVGNKVAFEPDPRRTVGYRFIRQLLWLIIGAWFRPAVSGRENVPAAGPVILAPVHRSFADFAFTGFATDRKLFFMAKGELWEHRLLGRLLFALGAFPVHRDVADREALRHAEEVLRRGQVLVLFPEGTRKTGRHVAELLEGAAFLAARTGAHIVPIGIGGSDDAMPKGRLVPKPLRITVVIGDPLAAPERSDGGRVARSKVHATTVALRQAIQDAYDRARSARPRGS